MGNPTRRVSFAAVFLVALPFAATCQDVVPPSFYTGFQEHPYSSPPVSQWVWVSAADREEPSLAWQHFCARVFHQGDFLWRKFEYIPCPGDLPTPIPTTAFQRHLNVCPLEMWIGQIDPPMLRGLSAYWPTKHITWRPWGELDFYIEWDRWYAKRTESTLLHPN